MSDMNWSCCPLVVQTPTTRAFIEQLVREPKSPSTIENYSRDLNDFLSAFPNIPFPDLLEADETLIAHYVDWLWTRDAQRGSGKSVDRGNITYLTGSKLAPATIRRRISALRSFYRWAIRLRQRRDPINPVREGMRGQERGLVSVPQSVPWIPDERQWKAILKYVLTRLSIRDQAIVLLAHDGALRREEIVLLRVDDIDRRTQTIAIRAEITKNHMPGVIVIFDRISDALQIPQLTPHKMRHLMLTELKRSGMELLDVSRYARHRRMSSTEIYLHTDLSDLARQVNKAHNHLTTLVEQVEAETHDEC